MPQLPERPDLDQLRRQARELHRAAAGGDIGARQRLRAVSERVTLSAAQLAIAREHGFPSWPRLKAEAERRRDADPGAGQPARPPAAQSRSWQDLRDWSAGLLRERSDEDVAAWNRRITESGIDDEPTLRAWLAGQGVTGYAQALLVWERFGYPGFLTAGADQLIDDQYADRPHLRPVLDAVLAALPALGPVTVQARKTFVSLVSPRRTFAVVQATTKKRVDLGLRLDGREPGGRLQAARDIGAATLRIALSGPEDLDDEALGWLQRAYEENTAPPPPRRRPAPRPRPDPRPLVVVIEGYDLPGRSCRPGPDGQGYDNVHVALPSHSKDRPGLTVPGCRWQAAEAVPGDAPSARWEVEVTTRRGDDGVDFGGRFVAGDRTDRNLGLAWGEVPGDGTFRLFRGVKLRLVDVDPSVIQEAMRPGHHLVARVRLTDARGNPICARVRPPYIAWSAEGAGPPGPGGGSG
jgi:hypothetical protein